MDESPRAVVPLYGASDLVRDLARFDWVDDPQDNRAKYFTGFVVDDRRLRDAFSLTYCHRYHVTLEAISSGKTFSVKGYLDYTLVTGLEQRGVKEIRAAGYELRDMTMEEFQNAHQGTVAYKLIVERLPREPDYAEDMIC